MARVPLHAASLALGLLMLTSKVQAQLELGRALRSLEQSGTAQLPRAMLRSPSGRVPVLAEYPRDAGVAELLVGGRYRPMWLTAQEIAALAYDQPAVQLHWAPPRHTLLDRADDWIGMPTFRQETALTGQGVVIGIVDTGLDVSHGDLRDAEGKSRVRFMLDFSRPPAERQPELEAEYGCTEETECAIYSNEDLDQVLDNGVTGDEPRDAYGHGTHVASLAAGNGLASKVPRYIGIAPEAIIFGARVSRSGDGSIFDADIILATRFIFEQAERHGWPAVVNLSLGSDFGTHDGSSPLEQALASFVGPEFPGRAIVVAAGNSGTVHSDLNTGEPEPLGIHTEVHVPHDSPVEIPLLTPSAASGASAGATIYAWLGFRPGDEVSVAVDHGGESWIPDIPPGRSTTFSKDGTDGTVFNGPTADSSSIRVGSSNAVVVLDGDFEPGTRFTLRLSGHGTASIWLQAGGGASPDISSGVLVPRAERQGTINIPASHPDLIAVGATVNRNRWRDSKNQPFLVGREEGGDELAELDGTAPFSAAGPNALGVMKPDIIAPGMYVVGAMSAAADPRSNGALGVFASNGRCGEPDYECFVIDDGEHAVTSGTSMSAPLVSGAIALLLERRPELTQAQLRTLLQAGARQPSGSILAEQQTGPGVLDLPRTLAALVAEDSLIDRVPTLGSRMILAAPFIHPDPGWPLTGLLELRDDQDRIADVADPQRLALEVTGGTLSKAPARLGPGLYGFEVTAPEGSGGKRLGLRLTFDGQILTSRDVPIGVDRWLAEGEPLARGGCSLAGAVPRTGGYGLVVAAALLALRRRRWAFTGSGSNSGTRPSSRRFTSRPGTRCSPRARTASRRDRMGGPARPRPDSRPL